MDTITTKDSRITPSTIARTKPSMVKKKTKDSTMEKMDTRNIITMKGTSTGNITTRRKVNKIIIENHVKI